MSIKNRILSLLAKRKWQILLIFASFFYIFIDFYYLTKDKTPQSWDQSGHLLYALSILEFLKKGCLLEAFRTTGFYPPFYYLTTIPIYLFKTVPLYPLFVNFLFLVILLFSVYKLATEYFDQRAGFIAALIIASYPWMIIQRRTYLLDFPLAAMVAASLYYFYKSDGLLKRSSTIFAGVITALCLLTKEFGAIYLLPFYAIIFITSFLKTKDKRLLLTNLAVFVIIVLVISSVWYIPSIKYIRQGFSDLMAYAKLEDDPIGFNLSSLTYYFNHFSWQLSPILFWITILSTFLISLTPRGRKFAVAVYPTVLFAYLAFVLIPNKDTRYSLPLFIFFSFITAGGLSAFKGKLIIFRHLFESVILIICVLQSLTLTFGWPNIKSSLYPLPTKPNRSDWKIMEIVKNIQNNSDRLPLSVAVLPDHPYINSSTFRYYSTLGHITTQYVSIPEPVNIIKARNLINNSDFVIDMEPVETAASQTFLRDNVIKARQEFLFNRSSFIEIWSSELPESSRLVLYKRI